jgi:hypothetical protein
MKTHRVIVEFARKYGIKEGIILTELCRRMKVSGTAAIPFSVSIGKQHFPYLTEKQIRISLTHLREQGCIVSAVCDGLAARIRALRSKDQGRQTVPEQRRGNEAKRNDLAIVEAEPPTAAKRKQPC